jgi:heme exporter protein D
MKYALYIYSAWGIAAFALVAVTTYTWLESRRLQKDLKRLEARGIRRRSSEPSGDPT